MTDVTTQVLVPESHSVSCFSVLRSGTEQTHVVEVQVDHLCFRSTDPNSICRMHTGRPRIHETSGGTGHNHTKRGHLTGRQVCRKETLCILSLTITLGD